MRSEATQPRSRLSLLDKLTAYWDLAHPFPLLIALLDGILYIGIIARGFNPVGPLLLLLVAKVGLTGFVDTVNDYFDQDLDRVAKPDRPIPSRRVSPNETLLLSLVWLVLVAGILGGVFNIWALAIGLGIIAIGTAYNWPLKRTPLSFLPFILGIPSQPVMIALALDRFDPVLLWVYPLSLFPFVGLHLINTLYDLESDGLFGLHGLAHILGKRRSLFVSWFCFFATWAVFVALSLVIHYNTLIFIPVAVVYLILTGLAIVLYYTDPRPKKLRAIWGLLMLNTGIVLLVGWTAAVLFA